jgi:hypothetical protein
MHPAKFIEKDMTIDDQIDSMIKYSSKIMQGILDNYNSASQNSINKLNKIS